MQTTNLQHTFTVHHRTPQSCTHARYNAAIFLPFPQNQQLGYKCLCFAPPQHYSYFNYDGIDNRKWSASKTSKHYCKTNNIHWLRLVSPPHHSHSNEKWYTKTMRIVRDRRALFNSVWSHDKYTTQWFWFLVYVSTVTESKCDSTDCFAMVHHFDSRTKWLWPCMWHNRLINLTNVSFNWVQIHFINMFIIIVV